MKTIVEPKEPIVRLWGKQKNKAEDTFRMMHYVLRVDYDDKVLLHNVITGQLVVLDQNEALVMNQFPLKYCHDLDQLIESHYLVPDQFDEHQLVWKIREVLRKLEEAQKKPGITHYTILPTTTCNARCYYCFEHGAKHVTMSEQTAEAVTEFIVSHCNENKQISLSWFGGEPTVAAKRIDQICGSLQKNGIRFESDITTNGYLFDEGMAQKAKNLWRLKVANITLDGTEKTYNRIKAYSGATDNPYQRVLKNIGLLMDQGIRIGLRMNFDLGNYHEFKELLKELKDRFFRNPLLQIHVHPVVGEYQDSSGNIFHGNDAWFGEKIIELNNMARDEGLLKSNDMLPCLQFKGCQANNDASLTITPEGNLVSCPEQFGDDQIIGTVWDGITNTDVIQSWKVFGEYPKCKECKLFPYCVRLSRCSVKDRCCFYEECLQQYCQSMKHFMCSYS